jgi:hypothetical protein
MFDFKNHVTKIMSKSPSRRIVKLQRKLKLTEKENNPHICKFHLYFSVTQCRPTSHQPFSVPDFRPNRRSRKTFDKFVSTKSVFFKFRFGGRGLQPGSPPLGAPMSGIIEVLLSIKSCVAEVTSPDFMLGRYTFENTPEVA